LAVDHHRADHGLETVVPDQAAGARHQSEGVDVPSDVVL
jgi:hypothetical protein